MSELKNKILELRSQGKTYDQIKTILNCSKGTISYYCGKNQHEKTRLRTAKTRSKQHPYVRKIESFIYKITTKKQPKQKISTVYHLIKSKIETFHYKDHKGMYQKTTFSVQDVLEKFGENPKCYLTGQEIDINKPRTYQFDHIIPRSRGGDNNINNLGICSKKANQSKHNMTPDEYINLCKQVLEHNGYQVTKSDGRGN